MIPLSIWCFCKFLKTTNWNFVVFEKFTRAYHQIALEVILSLKRYSCNFRSTIVLIFLISSRDKSAITGNQEDSDPFYGKLVTYWTKQTCQNGSLQKITWFEDSWQAIGHIVNKNPVCSESRRISSA